MHCPNSLTTFMVHHLACVFDRWTWVNLCRSDMSLFQYLKNKNVCIFFLNSLID